MNKWVGITVLGAALSGLTGCASFGSASGESARNYDFDALKQYANDSEERSNSTQWSLTSESASGASAQADEKAPNASVSYEGFYGKWVAKLDLTDEELKKEMAKQPADPNMDPEQQKMAEEFAKAMATAFSSMMTMDLEINKDGTFKLAMMGMPMEGDWSQKGDVLRLVPNKFMGMSAEDFKQMSGKENMDNNKPLDLYVSKDGLSLIARDPEGLDPQEFVFKRPE